MKTEDLSLPQQNYVEAISELVNEHGHAHPAKIAALLKVRKPSVTEAINRLVDLGIARRRDQIIMFTPKGKTIAEDLSGRHQALRSFMAKVLGMNPKDADTAACRMEHTANPKFIKRLKSFQEFMCTEKAALLKDQWLEMSETQHEA